MKSFRVLSVSLFLLFSYSSFCQKESERQLNPDSTVILDKRKTLQTDIYILNTCEPNQLSIVKMYDDYRQVQPVNKRRLSISTNRFSSFKIININPNRYNYTINNTLVTQFIDSNPFNTNTNTFVNGSALTKNDIEIIELFKADNNFESKRKKIDGIKKEMSLLTIEIQDASNQIEELYFEIESAKVTAKKEDEILKQIREIKTNKYLPAITKYDAQLSEYSILVNNLTINQDNLLKNFLNLKNDSSNLSDDFKSVIENIMQLANEFEKRILTMDDIKKQIRQLSDKSLSRFSTYTYSKENRNNNFYNSQKSELSIDPVGKLSSQYGYSVNLDNLNSYNASNVLLEITKMEEFISNRKIKDWEFFVLNTSKEVGKLLQNKIIEYSEKFNMKAQQTCLTTDDIDSINMISNDLRNNFRIIRNICADLNVLTNYLELDDLVFGKIVTGINSNYNILKKYLAYLDYTCKNNTVEFTLPTHTNLKNVDLIRYQISREDILTRSRQSYEYDIWIKGGLKIDFSAGIFATSLVDYKFEKLQAASKSDPSITLDDSIYVNRINTGNYDLAFGAMVNISIRTGASWFTPGISFGTAYAMNKKLQFLGAFSMQLGKTERLILHGGVAAGLATTLNLAALNYNREYENDGGKHYLVKGKYEDFNIPTIEKFSFKPFFGISYNLSKKNALSAASNSYNYSPTNSSVEVEPEETK